MASAWKHPLVLIIGVAVLGLALVGGMITTAQEATPATDSAACAEGSPAASPSATAIGSPTASPAASPTACPAGTPGGLATTVTIEAIDIDFLPAEVRIPANTDVTIVIPNLGVIPHNFMISELDINETFQAGETVEVVVNAPAGTYEYICNIPGHAPAGMTGMLIVE